MRFRPLAADQSLHAAAGEGLPEHKRERRQEYLDRIRRTAKGLSKSFVDKSIGDMQRRYDRLLRARRGLFEEGGRLGGR